MYLSMDLGWNPVVCAGETSAGPLSMSLTCGLPSGQMACEKNPEKGREAAAPSNMACEGLALRLAVDIQRGTQSTKRRWTIWKS